LLKMGKNKGGKESGDRIEGRKGEMNSLFWGEEKKKNKFKKRERTGPIRKGKWRTLERREPSEGQTRQGQKGKTYRTIWIAPRKLKAKRGKAKSGKKGKSRCCPVGPQEKGTSRGLK